jgi:hypothetical protein
MTPFRLAIALSALLLAGCKNNDIPEEIASIFVEASPTSGGSMRQEVRLPVIADDEDHVALPPPGLGRQFADVHAAGPVGRDPQFRGRRPRAPPQPLRASE